MKTSAPAAKRFKGLTLVELLMVMMITAIMSAVVWKAATKTIDCYNNSRVSIEISQMSKALDTFAMQFGEYPPDFHDQMAVWKFLKARFPNCPHQKYPSFANHSPASALFFWLAGPNGNGFSANPANPFDKGGRRLGPYFKFEHERVKMVDDVMLYIPPRSKTGTPYVYFRGTHDKGYNGHPGWETAKPYRDSVAGKWLEPDKFQILCPGNDGLFGAGNHYPGGPDYDDANYDDIASFSQGSTLDAQIPKLIPDKDESEEE